MTSQIFRNGRYRLIDRNRKKTGGRRREKIDQTEKEHWQRKEGTSHERIPKNIKTNKPPRITTEENARDPGSLREWWGEVEGSLLGQARET